MILYLLERIFSEFCGHRWENSKHGVNVVLVNTHHQEGHDTSIPFTVSVMICESYSLGLWSVRERCDISVPDCHN
jgi:hypothetical protein